MKKFIICNDEFYGRKERKFCSRKCYYSWRSLNIRGENHPNYKVNNIKNLSWLHTYLRKTWGVPKICDFCKKEKPLDLANKTGIYNKERKNWYWLCRKCHMTEDGRIKQSHYLKGHLNYHHGKQI